jgi:polar amino acid transport system permease protein
MVASLWYLVVTSVLMIGQYYVERHYARGSVRQLPPTPFQKLQYALHLRPREGPFETVPPTWVAPSAGPEPPHG